MSETINTRMMAPTNEGIIAMPARLGPHDPNNAWPREEPTNPAMMLAIQPMEPPRLVIAPATNPIKPPTINTQIQYIFSPLVFLCHESAIANSLSEYDIAGFDHDNEFLRNMWLFSILIIPDCFIKRYIY